jgi:hypothetical protein
VSRLRQFVEHAAGRRDPLIERLGLRGGPGAAQVHDIGQQPVQEYPQLCIGRRFAQRSAVQGEDHLGGDVAGDVTRARLLAHEPGSVVRDLCEKDLDPRRQIPPRRPAGEVTHRVDERTGV